MYLHYMTDMTTPQHKNPWLNAWIYKYIILVERRTFYLSNDIKYYSGRKHNSQLILFF